MAEDRWVDVGPAEELRAGMAALVERCTALATRLLASEHTLERVARGGRKAHALAAED
jgi:hypothetical protein